MSVQDAINGQTCIRYPEVFLLGVSDVVLQSCVVSPLGQQLLFGGAEDVLDALQLFCILLKLDVL